MAIITMLGIDPSLTHTGWAVAQVETVTRKIVGVLDMGTVVTAPSKNKRVRKSSANLERAGDIAFKLNDAITTYNIKVGASEVPSGAQSANAALAFGIVIGLLASLPVPLIEVNPSEVKMAVAGNKIADKEDMVRWAVGLTERLGEAAPVQWGTSKGKNEWEIELGGRYVLKNMEHQADALAAIQAAISSSQFKQLTGIVNSLS